MAQGRAVLGGPAQNVAPPGSVCIFRVVSPTDVTHQPQAHPTQSPWLGRAWGQIFTVVAWLSGPVCSLLS